MEVKTQMNLIKEPKKQYGKQYLFLKCLSDRQVSKLKSAPPSSFSDTTAASLEVGCVRLDAVLFLSPVGVELAYDILVKDSPDSLEWICYDSIPAKGAKEPDMAAALDNYVSEYGLSYTDCCFKRLDGKIVKKEKAGL